MTVLREIPGCGVYFWCYEWLNRMLMKPEPEDHFDKMLRITIAGGFAGSISWASIYPFDVLKTRLQTQPDVPSPRYNGIVDCFRKSVKAEGPRFLFKGLTTTIVRAFPVNSVTFLVYEYTLSLLSSLERTVITT